MPAKGHKSREARKLVSVVSPTFNEEGNVEELLSRLNTVAKQIDHDFEFIIIDNASTDNTAKIVEQLAERDSRVRLIVNATNFGHLRSPYHGLLQASGDAVILIASDLQDPPEKVQELVGEWDSGGKVVLLVRESSDESGAIVLLRRMFYSILGKLSSGFLIPNSTGSGLFDREVVEHLRRLEDPYPFLRGMLVELGFPVRTVPFRQSLRKAGKTKNNLSTLFDLAMLGLISHSTRGARLITVLGMVSSMIGFCIGLFYLVTKLMFWDTFDLGEAPMLIGVFFFGSLQVFLIGILAEYLGSIQRRLKRMPLVIEDRRVNF